MVSDGRVAALDELLRASATTVARLAESDQLPDVLPATEPGEVAQLLDADGLVLATSASGSRTLAVVPASVLADAEREVAGEPTPLPRTAAQAGRARAPHHGPLRLRRRAGPHRRRARRVAGRQPPGP